MDAPGRGRALSEGHRDSAPGKGAPLILPDFVLGGAPKCGTGSVFGWLSEHPQLCGSTPKEPFYFMDSSNPLMDPSANVHRLGLEGWAQSFDNPLRQHGKLYFEGTTHLIYQETALSVLPGLPTRPKFIFLVRDPVDRVASSFNYTQWNLAQVTGRLTIDRYFEMLVSGDTSTLRHYIASEQSAYVLQRDLQYSNYWPYLCRWLEAVGPERMLVLQFERLVRDPLACMREICGFLGVSSDHFERDYEFVTRNATIRLASSGLHRWATRAARLVPAGHFKSTLRRAYYWAQQRNTVTSKVPPSARLCEQLRRQLEPGTSKLGETFRLDLDLWGSAAQALEKR
jgi:hypothetical protein